MTDQAHTGVHRQLAAEIQATGYGVVGIPDQLGAYAYTVGLTGRGLREIFCTGEAITVIRDDLTCIAHHIVNNFTDEEHAMESVRIDTRRGAFVLTHTPRASLLREAICLYGADAVSAWEATVVRL